jgi:hypothetical protein
MVLYGDSRAAMWLPAFESIATASHWKLVLLNKDDCPAEPITFNNVCDQWHIWATHWINTHDPSLVVISQLSAYQRPPSPTHWQTGLAALFASIKVPSLRTVYLCGTPDVAKGTPQCLSTHVANVQHCASPVQQAVPLYNPIERAASQAAGVDYIDPTPWFCTTICSPIIGNHVVYIDGFHITATWAKYLWLVLSDALGISTRHG